MATFAGPPVSADNETAPRRNNHLAPHPPSPADTARRRAATRACPASGRCRTPLRGGRRRLAGRRLDRRGRGLGRERRGLDRGRGRIRIGARAGWRARDGGGGQDQHDQQTLHASPPEGMASTGGDARSRGRRPWDHRSRRTRTGTSHPVRTGLHQPDRTIAAGGRGVRCRWNAVCRSRGRGAHAFAATLQLLGPGATLGRAAGERIDGRRRARGGGRGADGEKAR